MIWSFEIAAEFQKQLDQAPEFVREEIGPFESVLGHPYNVKAPRRNALVRDQCTEMSEAAA